MQVNESVLLRDPAHLARDVMAVQQRLGDPVVGGRPLFSLHAQEPGELADALALYRRSRRSSPPSGVKRGAPSGALRRARFSRLAIR